MALNLTNLTPASLKSKNVATEDYVDTNITNSGYVLPDGVAEAINTNTTTIDGAKITTGSITAGQIATGTLTANEIAANTITAGNLNVTDLSAVSANLGTISVDTANIASGAITNAKIANAAITTAKIGTAQVDTLEIKGQAVTIPTSAFLSGGSYTNGSVVIDVYHVATGAPITVFFSAYIVSDSRTFITLYRDSTFLYASSAGTQEFAKIISDTPSAGGHWYKVEVYHDANSGINTVTSRYLGLLETKR
jgi:hypothetical protein